MALTGTRIDRTMCGSRFLRSSVSSEFSLLLDMIRAHNNNFNCGRL